MMIDRGTPSGEDSEIRTAAQSHSVADPFLFKRDRPTFPEHAMNIAEAASHRSEDPYCRVGATVLNSRGVVLGVGYNGAPSGVDVDMADRDARRPAMVHAEANALRYVTPESARNGLLAVTHWPCAPCVLLASTYGIATILWRYSPDWDRYPKGSVEELAETVRVNLKRDMRVGYER